MPKRHQPPSENKETPLLGGHDFPYGMVLNNAIVGICFLDQRQILWANARMADILGYADGELVHKNVRILYPSGEEYDDVAGIYPALARDNYYVHERQMIKKSGERLWCMLSGCLSDPKDPQSPSVWVLQDISRRKKAEEQLNRTNQRLEQMVESRTQSLQRANQSLRTEVARRQQAQIGAMESREKYRSLFRNLPLGVLVTSPQSEVIEFNRTLQASLGATTKKELLILLEDPARVIEAGGTRSLATLLRQHGVPQGGQADRFEFSWALRTGIRREFSVIAAPMKGPASGVVYSFTDVTEQLRASEREHEQQVALAHAARLSLMGQMASSLAHELGQPLNACQSYITGLQLRLPKAVMALPDVTHAIDKISAHLSHARDIIRNVRTFVSRRPQQFAPTDLMDGIHKTLALLDVQLRIAGVKPIIVAEDDLPPARCNMVEIQQVLINLLINSLDAMHETAAGQRKLEIHVKREKNAMLSVTVNDNGSGITAAVASQLFEPYFTTKDEGLGMGLMICRTIIESHGGAIDITPLRGGGACCKFTLRAED